MMIMLFDLLVLLGYWALNHQNPGLAMIRVDLQTGMGVFPTENSFAFPAVGLPEGIAKGVEMATYK